MLRYIIKFLFLLISGGALAQPAVSVQLEAVQLKKKIQELHVSPKPVNDSFSSFVFDLFLKALDPDKLYFTQDDIRELAVYKNKIDDELSGTSWEFLPAITDRYKKSLLRAEGIITQHTRSGFDFLKNDRIVSDTNWRLNESGLANYWYLHLKFETLNELIRLKINLPELSDKEFLLKKEPEGRQRAKRTSLRMIKRILDHPSGYENHIASLFMRSVGLAFDPHSTHFSFTEMQNFMTSVSTEGFYFGITIDENERGDIVISELAPGGPAWKSGEIHSGDVIEQIRWAGKDWVEVIGMSKEEMNDLLMESNQDAIEFALVQTGNIQKTVRLRKEKMQAEENVVKSFILEGEKRIGYVSLPGFYAAWGNDESSRCANDVAKEILKLKKENIDGLVLDVRYNGGGSLYEAVAMAGIFIDAGPMTVLKDKAGNIASLKDMNRGTVYDGPLVLLVNGISASASEILAAALQDHHRAIIVGSRTYGKATGQEIIPMHPDKTKIDATLDLKSGWGFSTITTLKIYRVTGKTAQKYGVIPDISLPDFYDFIKFRESYLPGALPSDSVLKKTYYTPLKLLPLKELKEKSEARVARSMAFQLTARCSKKIAELKEKMDSVSLNWVDYRELVDHEGKEFELLKEANDKPTIAYKVSSHAFDKQRIQVDDYLKQTNDVWMKNLLRDISLEEAFYIICDYIAATPLK